VLTTRPKTREFILWRAITKVLWPCATPPRLDDYLDASPLTSCAPPSVEPQGDWGEGMVALIEIFLRSGRNDQICRLLLDLIKKRVSLAGTAKSISTVETGHGTPPAPSSTLCSSFTHTLPDPWRVAGVNRGMIAENLSSTWKVQL